MSIINDLNWRYATKRMTGEKVPGEKLQAILDATELSASSYGLQPYRILVIKNEELREKLKPAAFHQPQLTESDSILLFCIPETITADHINDYILRIASTRNIPAESLEGFKSVMLGSINVMDEQQQQEWAARQAYIGLGTALIAAAEQKVDACPMEGFDKQQFADILGLKESGLKPVVMMAIGYRSPDDAMASQLKVRKTKEELFQIIE